MFIKWINMWFQCAITHHTFVSYILFVSLMYKFWEIIARNTFQSNEKDLHLIQALFQPVPLFNAYSWSNDTLIVYGESGWDTEFLVRSSRKITAENMDKINDLLITVLFFVWNKSLGLLYILRRNVPCDHGIREHPLYPLGM